MSIFKIILKKGFFPLKSGFVVKQQFFHYW